MPPELADTLARIREITARFGGTQTPAPVTAGNSAFAQTLSAALGTQSDSASDGSSAAAALTSALGGTDTSKVSAAVRALLGATGTAGATGVDGTAGAASGAELGEQAVTLAKSYTGTPYLWGGTDPGKGLDCSGLTQLVFRRLGVDLPRTSAEQAKAGEKVASLADARPGDLVFFGSPVHHVGVYAGDGMMVDAPHKGATVGLHKVWSSLTGIRRVTTDDAAQGSRAAQLQAVAAALPALSQLGALSALDGTADGAANGAASGATSGAAFGAASGAYAGLVRLPGSGTSSGSVDDLLSALARRPLAGATVTSPGAASGNVSDPVGTVRAATGPGATQPGTRSGGVPGVGSGREVTGGPGATQPGTRSGGLPGLGSGGTKPVPGNGSAPSGQTYTTTVNALLAAQRGFGFGAPGGIMGSAGEHAVTLQAGGTAATARASAATAAGYATAGPSAIATAQATTASSAGWRTAPYADLFAAAGTKYGVDPALLSAIAKAESAYRPAVTSHAGAVGLMQIMPATARGLGVDPTDPAQAVDGAARLVSGYLKTYDGDITKVLAAYNAGPGAVKKYGGVPPYAETRTYVQRVTGYWEDLR